jgi:hypothetical protein
MPDTRSLETLQGRVVEKRVLGGTASDHVAVVLETEGGEAVRLQRIGGNPFRDDETRKLIGRTVAVDGFRLGDIFRFTKVPED